MEKNFNFNEKEEILTFIRDSEIEGIQTQINHIRNGEEMLIRVRVIGDPNNIQIFFIDLTAYLK